MPQLNFDATNVPVAKPLTIMPAGQYLGRIVGSDLQETQNKTGVMLVLSIELIEPADYRGRKLIDRLNVNNQNPTAQRIAQETLSAICHAIGKPRVAQSEELHGFPLAIMLGVEKDPTGEYEPKNRIRGYEPASAYKAPAGLNLGGAAGAAAPFGAAQTFVGQPTLQGQAPQPFAPATAAQMPFQSQAQTPQPGMPYGYPQQPAFPTGVGADPSQQNAAQNGQGAALPAGWGQAATVAPQTSPAPAQGAPWAPAGAPAGWTPQAAAQQPQPQVTASQPGWQPQRQQG